MDDGVIATSSFDASVAHQQLVHDLVVSANYHKRYFLKFTSSTCAVHTTS